MEIGRDDSLSQNSIGNGLTVGLIAPSRKIIGGRSIVTKLLSLANVSSLVCIKVLSFQSKSSFKLRHDNVQKEEHLVNMNSKGHGHTLIVLKSWVIDPQMHGIQFYQECISAHETKSILKFCCFCYLSCLLFDSNRKENREDHKRNSKKEHLKKQSARVGL